MMSVESVLADLNREALGLARRFSAVESPGSKRVASEAIKELKNEAVQRRLRRSS